MPDNFDLATMNTRTGPKTYPCEHTSSPHLVILATARDDHNDGPAFGGWSITHVPTGKTIPLPIPHCDEIERVRWAAARLAESDIDWTTSAEEFKPELLSLTRELIAQMDKEEQENTPPGVIPVSTMRDICATNARIAKERGWDREIADARD